jgi:hypothetical protein
MTDTDLHQPDPGPLRAAAETAELVQTVSGLAGIDGCRLAYSDPLALLAFDIARCLTEAGLTVYHCAQHDPLYRHGGVFVLADPGPVTAGSPCPGLRTTGFCWTGAGPAFTPVRSRP